MSLCSLFKETSNFLSGTQAAMISCENSSGWSEHARTQTKDNVRERTKNLPLDISTPASQKDWNIVLQRLRLLSHSQLLLTTSPSPSINNTVGSSRSIPNPPNISQDVNTNDSSPWSARPYGHLCPAHQRRVFHEHPPPRPNAPRGTSQRRALWILHRRGTLEQDPTGEGRQSWDAETAVDNARLFQGWVRHRGLRL